VKELESENDLEIQEDDDDADLKALEKEGLDDISHEEISGLDLKNVLY